MIRPALPADCSNIAALSIETWLETYAKDGIKTAYSDFVLAEFTRDSILKWLNSSNYKLFVYMEADFIQGYILINQESRFETPDNGFEVEKLYVRHSSRNTGMGRKLLAYAQQALHLKNFWLYTWVKNDSNAFYLNLGLEKIGQYNFEFENSLIENNVYACKFFL